MATESENLESLVNRRYEHGFVTEIATDSLPPGLDEDVIRAISARKKEPEWLLDWRLQAYARWQQMKEPDWAMVNYPEIDFQDQYYYARPKSMETKPKSLDEVDDEVLRTFDKLGIPLQEREWLAGVAVDAAGNVLSAVRNME